MPKVALRSVLLSLLFAVCVLAQRDLGTITGTITDAQGAAVPNAAVTIVEDATGLSYTATTGMSGEYVRPLLKPGTYTVTVQAQGFRKVDQNTAFFTPTTHTTHTLPSPSPHITPP